MYGHSFLMFLGVKGKMSQTIQTLIETYEKRLVDLERLKQKIDTEIFENCITCKIIELTNVIKDLRGLIQ